MALTRRPRAQVELTSRTGRNPQVSARTAAACSRTRPADQRTPPQYSYLSLGCSKRAEQAMLSYARSLVGRPFSNIGMARSVVFPRRTDEKTFFCAGIAQHAQPGETRADAGVCSSQSWSPQS